MRARQAAFLNLEGSKTETGPMLAFDGCDHLAWDSADYAVLFAPNGHDPEYALMHTSLDAYMREMLAQRDKITTVLEGELRDPALYPSHVEAQWLIPGVGSSRVNLKLAVRLLSLPPVGSH
jgi:alpha-mannosidase/mannosylglycerate hydrolase